MSFAWWRKFFQENLFGNDWGMKFPRIWLQVIICVKAPSIDPFWLMVHSFMEVRLPWPWQLRTIPVPSCIIMTYLLFLITFLLELAAYPITAPYISAEIANYNSKIGETRFNSIMSSPVSTLKKWENYIPSCSNVNVYALVMAWYNIIKLIL